MIILLIIFYLILFILLLTLFLISIPYKYILFYSYDEKLNFNIAIQTFLFSFVYIKEDEKESTYLKILSFKKEFEKKKKEPTEKEIEEKITEKIEKAQKEKKSKKDKKKKFNFPFKIISIENLKHVFKLIIDIFKMIIPKHLRLYFLVGLTEPHLNGWLLAYFHSLKGIYPNLPINIDVNWEEEIFKSEGELSGKIIPIQLFLRVLIFIFSMRTLKIAWQVFKYNRRK